MCTCDEVLRYLYYNWFMENYYVWRFYGEDDNFIQIDNDILRASTFGEPCGFFVDLFVDVTNGYIGVHVQTSQDVQGTTYLPIQSSAKVKAFYGLLDQEK